MTVIDQVAVECPDGCGVRALRSAFEDQGCPECGATYRAPTPADGTLAKLEDATVDTAGLKAMPRPDYLVDGILARSTLAMLYGAPGDGKTHVAIDLALHIAHGAWWNRREVHGGPVVYVAAEGAARLGDRVAAWQTHRRAAAITHPVHWLTIPVHLYQSAWADAFTAYCAARQPVLVVVDTLARCALGADENSARDMGVIVDHLDQTKRATGASILIVHHSGKETSAGARGSTALKGAVDTELQVTAADTRHTLKITKQKDGAEPQPYRFVRQPAGDSVVLVPDRGQSTDGDTDLTATGTAILDALRSVEVPGGVSSKIWLTAAADTVSERSFWNWRSRLLAQGHVTNLGNDHRPSYITTERLQDDAEAAP